MSKHSAQIKKLLDYDDQLKGRKQPIEVQLEQARREQRELFIATLQKHRPTLAFPDKCNQLVADVIDDMLKEIQDA